MARTSTRRTAGAGWLPLALLLVLGPALAGCYDAEDDTHRRRGPMGAEANRIRAARMTDSLRTTVPAGGFTAWLTGDRMNRDIEAVLTASRFAGPARYRVVPATERELLRVVITLDTPEGNAVRLEWTTAVDDPAVETAPEPPGRPLLVRQRYEDRRPTVKAYVRDGRFLYESRDGYLELDEAADGALRGTFFFEMQEQSEQPPTNWFELAGAFDATN